MTVRSIGIFYGSSGGATADVAGQIADSLLSLTGLRVTLADIAKTDMAALPPDAAGLLYLELGRPARRLGTGFQAVQRTGLGVT